MNILLEILGMLISIFLIFMHNKKEEHPAPKNQDADTRRIIRVYCEKIGEIHYAWLEDTQNFIGQSKSPRELALLLMSKYPTKTHNVIIEEKVT